MRSKADPVHVCPAQHTSSPSPHFAHASPQVVGGGVGENVGAAVGGVGAMVGAPVGGVGDPVGTPVGAAVGGVGDFVGDVVGVGVGPLGMMRTSAAIRMGKGEGGGGKTVIGQPADCRGVTPPFSFSFSSSLPLLTNSQRSNRAPSSYRGRT
jgi:hypothetical protein